MFDESPQDRILGPQMPSKETMDRINSAALSDVMCKAYFGRLLQFSTRVHDKYKGEKRLIPVPTNKAGSGELDISIFSGMVEPLLKSGKIHFKSVDVGSEEKPELKYSIKPIFNPKEDRIEVEIDSRYNTEIIKDEDLGTVRDKLPKATGELYELILEHYNEQAA